MKNSRSAAGLPALLFACAAALLAVGDATAATPAQAPDQAIRATTEKLRADINRNHALYEKDSAKFYKMVDQVVVPRFDVPYIAQIVLGREWKTASEAQRKRFTAAFKNSLVNSYASALLEYHDSVKEEWQPLRMSPGAKEVTVTARVKRENGQPLELDFQMHQAGGDWKVYDVNVEGVSIAAGFRAQFAAEIRMNGLDSLIARLEGGGKPTMDKPVPTGG